ncbi:MAG TPA: hypothetical protein VF809_00320 [Candidatus Saccharimonadales bacterium]
MSITNEKTTLYIDPRIKRGVQFYALRDKRSLSDIVNEKLFEYLEDMADCAVIEARKGEPTTPFEEVAKGFGFTLDDVRDQIQEKRAKRAEKA